MPDIQLTGRSGNPLLKTPDRVLFADNFNRADGDLNGQPTPVGGFVWQTRSDGSAAVKSAVIRGGRAGILTDTANAILFGLIDAGVSDGIYEIEFGSGEGNTVNVFPFRAATVNNHLQLTVTNGWWTLRKRNSGTYSTIAVSQIQKAPGQRIRVVMKGPSIKIYVNGALALDVLEADHATNTMFGFGGLGMSTTIPLTLWDEVRYIIPGS